MQLFKILHNSPKVMLETSDMYHLIYEVSKHSENDIIISIQNTRNCLYSLYEVKNYKNGEKLKHVGNVYPQTCILPYDKVIITQQSQEISKVEMIFEKSVLKRRIKQPTVSTFSYTYDMEKLYLEILEREKTSTIKTLEN